MPSADISYQYYRYSLSAGWESLHAPVIVEATVGLSVNGEPWLSFSCTPTNLEALAVGFLYNEGILQSREEIALVDVCQEGTHVDVWLHHAVERPTQWQRTSGCTGGVTAAGNPPEILSAVHDCQQIDPKRVINCMDQLLNAQELYREAGGVHSSALSDGQEIRLQAEDIGRHNTIDKLSGRLLLAEVHFEPCILLTTGRVSSEMLQKSARLGVATVVSRTSPTSQSIALADQLGITLVGYARRSSFLAYTHPERLRA